MSTKLISYLQKLSDTSASERADMVELLRLKNYGSNELSENEMWVISTASKDSTYLNTKLNEKMALDDEAPVEEEELSLDAPAEEAPATDAAPAEGEEELSLDAPAEEAPATDAAPAEGEEELSLDGLEDDSEEEEPKIETSLAGVGILPLLAEIQEKLANGKPSEVELAALKAMKKLF